MNIVYISRIGTFMNIWFVTVLPDCHLSLQAIESNDVNAEIFQ